MALYDTIFSDLLGRPVVLGVDYILQSDNGTTTRLITLPERLEPLTTSVVAAALIGNRPNIEYISKLTIIDRLIATNKFDAAMAALDASNRQTRERWTAATLIDKEDNDVVALLTAIGADVNVIMA